MFFSVAGGGIIIYKEENRLKLCLMSIFAAGI